MSRCRLAIPNDAAAIAAIYNEGIEDRVATFETRHRSADDILTWFSGHHPIVVVEDAGEIVAFAGTSTYRSRPCYAGIAEFSVYVARRHRGHGHGRRAMQALCQEAERAGFWKIVSRVFVENSSSRELLKKLGFREVGVYLRHGKLDGVWRDAVIVEKLLGEAAE
jgi:L-amino acid N-acyltransferase YncA